MITFVALKHTYSQIVGKQEIRYTRSYSTLINITHAEQSK